MTVLDIIGDEGRVTDAQDAKTSQPRTEAQSKNVAGSIKRTANQAAKTNPENTEIADGEVHISVTNKDGELADALGKGSDQGHDLLFVGIETTGDATGGYNPRIEIMTSAFKGTAAIVTARGTVPDEDKSLRILLPISGTERSMNASEFAFVIARATGCAITAVYVREPTQTTPVPRVSDSRNAHLAAFQELDQIAAYYEVKVEKYVQDGSSPEIAILKQAREGRFNLIVLGVSRRVGKKLSYGTVADTLLETADRSFVFIET
ncbi:universal stress protein [Rhizobium sp. LjRoot98]